MSNREFNKISSDFWKGKKVYVTGHTGFKGSWLCLWLLHLGADVKGYALAPNTNPNLFEEFNLEQTMDSEIGDIRDLSRLTKSMTDFNPDIVLHLAAQPLVRFSYNEPVETYSINVMGTVHLLEACRKLENLKSIVCITTDKCYENREWEWGYRENEPMGGYDPYSSSKGCSELVISSFRRSFFQGNDSANLASARAGNVIGGGDWSEDRLIPDIIRAFEKNQPVIIRNPLSTRPWQHVLEPLSGYLVLAEKLYREGEQYAEAWNFGPKDSDCQSVQWILDKMISRWGDNASWELDKNSNPHEAAFLKLDCSKAKLKLKWIPRWDLEFTLAKIIDWHKKKLKNINIKEESLEEIKHYMNS